MIRMGVALVGAVAAGAMWLAPARAFEGAGGGAPVPGHGGERMVRAVDGVPRALLLGREVDLLIDNVVALNEHHGWRWSEAGSLIASLEEAFIDLDEGRFDKAARQLGAFRDRVRGYLRDGTMPRDAGTPLLDVAGAIQARVEALDRAGRLDRP
jgi:hypothetical protein